MNALCASMAEAEEVEVAAGVGHSHLSLPPRPHISAKVWRLPLPLGLSSTSQGGWRMAAWWRTSAHSNTPEAVRLWGSAHFFPSPADGMDGGGDGAFLLPEAAGTCPSGRGPFLKLCVPPLILSLQPADSG
jgi:hypothetical protein